jgi:hypothetical protein
MGLEFVNPSVPIPAPLNAYKVVGVVAVGANSVDRGLGLIAQHMGRPSYRCVTPCHHPPAYNPDAGTPTANDRNPAMTSKWVGAALLTVALAAVGRGDEAPDAELGKLRERVKKLEADNAALRAEVARLKRSANVPATDSGEAHQAGLRKLLELERSLAEKPDDPAVRKEAGDLAAKLAPDLPGNRLVWGVLLKAGVLKDGMSLNDAEKLLGPPTDKSGKVVGWYFNPTNRHVAPYLHAQPTKDALTGWKLTSR